MKTKLEEALEKNATWELVTLPDGKSTVGCRRVFIVKHKAGGSVERYKTRLVTKGYTQSFGVDYQETFAPVAKLNTMRELLSLAANQDWSLLQFDVKKCLFTWRFNGRSLYGSSSWYTKVLKYSFGV